MPQKNPPVHFSLQLQQTLKHCVGGRAKDDKGFSGISPASLFCTTGQPRGIRDLDTKSKLFRFGFFFRFVFRFIFRFVFCFVFCFRKIKGHGKDKGPLVNFPAFPTSGGLQEEKEGKNQNQVIIVFSYSFSSSALAGEASHLCSRAIASKKRGRTRPVKTASIEK